MHNLPALISDLALILIVAGIVTLLFKRLHQPLVLGYIVAGFLAGPHMPYMPTVKDPNSIETWSSIGVIFLMFTLGLEFSFKKIIKMGMRPVIAACMVLTCMIGVGSTVGRLFDWSSTDCLFLGGMLAMSSTTIIYKAYEDLGLRQKRFAGEVLSVLILEDILGIVLMVLLSATAVSQQFEGEELAKSLLSLGFFLILWFVVGIYIIPAFLKRFRSLINNETLLVVSIGLCFTLVVLADQAGYSSAFGAFMMGSILSETIEAEKIEHLISPVKDLFGAIFFVSVGMMVSPDVLLQYWPAILAITLAILLGQAIFGTLSFVVAGHPLHRAMNCGFSLAQIGEFAFIIASLGISLKVTSSFLYPVVVAVSIVTTFLTPYMIKAADPAYAAITHHFPKIFSRHTAAIDADTKDTETIRSVLLTKKKILIPNDVSSYLKAITLQTAVFGVLTFATLTICFSALLPALRKLLTHWPGNATAGLFTLLVISLFLRPIMIRKNNSEAAQSLRTTRSGRSLLHIVQLLRWCLGIYTVFYILEYLSPLRWYYHLPASCLLVFLIIRSRVIKYYSIRMERHFVHNLRQRETAEQQYRSSQGYAGRLAARDVHFSRVVVPAFSRWAGQSLTELDFTNREGVLVVAILRQDHRINTPDGHVRIYPGDVLEIVADDAGLESFSHRMEEETDTPSPSDGIDHTLRLRRLVVSTDSPLINCSIAESGIREQFGCILIGFEEDDGNICVAEARRIIHPNDILWIVGEIPRLKKLQTVVTQK